MTPQLGEEPGLPNGTAKRKLNELDKAAARTRQFGLALVALGVGAMILAAAFGGWNTYRLYQIGRDNRQLLQANTDAQKRAAEGAQFAIDAVNCIRFSLLEHRWVNEEYHREQALRLGVPPPSHAPLPPRPTDAEIAMACQAFDDGTNVLPPKIDQPTTTTKGER